MASRTVPNTASELLPSNRLRRSFVVQNEDASLAVFIKREGNDATTVSTTDHDHRLGPGAALALNFGTDGETSIQGRFTIIAESGTPRVSYFETEDVRR
jgi:hypothetical protein